MLAASLLCVDQTSLAAVRQLRGMLLEDSGGVSGTATGEIKLLVAGHIFTLGYQKPYPQRDESTRCHFAGSIWTVGVDRLVGFGGQLASARCSGAVDANIYGAIELVKTCLRAMASLDYFSAYGLTSNDYRLHHSLTEFQNSLSEVNLSFYESGNAGTCLAVTRISNARAITITAGPDCGIAATGSRLPINLLFDATRKERSSKWELSTISRIRS